MIKASFISYGLNITYAKCWLSQQFPRQIEDDFCADTIQYWYYVCYVSNLANYTYGNVQQSPN